MSDRAQRLSEEYLNILTTYNRTTKLKKHQIGGKALAGFLRMIVDECNTITFKTSKELYEIADELDNME